MKPSASLWNKLLSFSCQRSRKKNPHHPAPKSALLFLRGKQKSGNAVSDIWDVKLSLWVDISMCIFLLVSFCSMMPMDGGSRTCPQPFSMKMFLLKDAPHILTILICWLISLNDPELCFVCYLCQGGHVFSCIGLSICLQDNSKTSWQNFLKLGRYRAWEEEQSIYR